MITSSPEMKILTARVAWLTALSATALAVAVVALFLPRTAGISLPQTRRVTEASEFAVHDDDGRLRGRWTAQGITLVDKDGRMRAGVSTGEEGAPTLTLVSKDGKVRASLGIGSGDAPGLTFHDQSGRLRARIALTPDDAPHITLYDEKGEALSEMPVAHLDASPSETAKTLSDKRPRSRSR